MTDFHPDLRSAARWLPRGVGRSWLLKLMRWLPQAPAPRLRGGLSLKELSLDERPGVRLRVISAEGSMNRPVLLWIHGGGYVIGQASQDDVLCAKFATALGLTVVSVDYRVAPEHPFPTPLEDCFAAWQWIQREGASHGIDPSRLIIGGQSAGGGLAAALTLFLKDRNQALPKLQLLVYPMIDDRTVLRAVDDSKLRVWDSASNRLGWASYLGREPGGEGVIDHAAPARRVDFSGLPPAWIGVGTRDLFHDEDLAYAARLQAAGVPTTLEVVEGAFHGFNAVLPKAPVSVKFFESQANAIRQALST